MAVISISRIQIRRGFQEELPQLASGEMGWSIDQRRLFIGNGTLSEGAPAIGNTEILTQNSDVLSAIASYAFVGIESGYRSVTGVSLSTPTFRTLQNKIDETMASVRDFGAIGNGIADDTVSLQRAINQVWPPSFFNTVGIRRRLHVPAGTYLISAALTIPPFASIYGDGALSSIIKQVYSAADSTIKLSDSKGQVDGALGTNGAILPFQIDINDLTLSNITDNHIAIVNSAKDVAFNRVKFLGNIAAPVSVGTSRAAVLLIGSTNPVTRVSFNACHASQITYGVVAQGAVSDVVGEICEFDTLYNAMQLSAASGASPSGIKILTSSFANIANAAIVSNDYSSVTSAFNHYKTVGYGNATIINSGMVSTPALQWANPNNYSIGDLFDRTAKSRYYSINYHYQYEYTNRPSANSIGIIANGYWVHRNTS